ncbi:MAG: hypothetical protein EOP49_39750, partial [Sphingobacteriales bacterium]
MKQLLFIGLMLLGIGQTASFAQQGNTDDIYFNSSDLEKQKQEDRKRAEKERLARQNNEDQYASSGNDFGDRDDDGYQSYNKSYDNDGYIDYDNEDYYYSTRIRRFNQPFYNMGYFSTFQNPFWYNPYWYDPYWGYSWWNRPTVSIMIGGGPYWSSYWGWHNWYGYGGFGSYWNYPVYASWYGGNYYNGFWNGYYAGLYDNGYGGGYGNGGGRTVTYGPRNSSNFSYNAGARNANGIRVNSANPDGPRPGSRLSNNASRNNVIERPNRNQNAAPDRNAADNNAGRNRGSFEQRNADQRAGDAGQNTARPN